MGGGTQQLGGYGGGNFGNWGGAGSFTGGTPLSNPQAQNGVGSASWVATHPNFQAPAQGVGSMDWIKTHPNYGGQQQGQNMFTGGAPLKPPYQSDANTPLQMPQQGQGDMMDALRRMFGGGGGGLGPFMNY